jgi:hypothetical protein
MTMNYILSLILTIAWIFPSGKKEEPVKKKDDGVWITIPIKNYAKERKKELGIVDMKPKKILPLENKQPL